MVIRMLILCKFQYFQKTVELVNVCSLLAVLGNLEIIFVSTKVLFNRKYYCFGTSYFSKSYGIVVIIKKVS